MSTAVRPNAVGGAAVDSQWAVETHGLTLIPESTLAASLVIVGWLAFWTAWRMMSRDA